jgi:hypothetical protein
MQYIPTLARNTSDQRGTASLFADQAYVAMETRRIEFKAIDLFLSADGGQLRAQWGGRERKALTSHDQASLASGPILQKHYIDNEHTTWFSSGTTNDKLRLEILLSHLCANQGFVPSSPSLRAESMG